MHKFSSVFSVFSDRSLEPPRIDMKGEILNKIYLASCIKRNVKTLRTKVIN